MHIRRSILFALTGVLFTLPAHSQNIQEASSSSSDWQHFESLAAAPDEMLEVVRTNMAMGPEDELILNSFQIDNMGWKHYGFQQYHNGYPVEFALYKMHEHNGIVIKGNGKLVEDVEVKLDAALSEEEALQLALLEVDAERYAWEDAAMERMIKHAKNDTSKTFYPKGKLMIVDGNFESVPGTNYRLAWKFEIHTTRPHEGREWVYVDAKDGSIVKQLDVHMHEGTYEGTAETRYSGVQSIVCDSTTEGYVLRDYSRGYGVEVYDGVDSFDIQYAVDFVDDDNYWDNANDRADDAATDAHWATEKLYDYLRDVHGMASYDGQDSRMIAYVHVGQNWYNATWNGFWSRYGDAGGDPWTNVDVVGHEFAHGITWATSALLYTRESGAMNESFSDIVGEALQHYVSGTADWVATPSPFDTLRSYSDPKRFGHPDTYLGSNWATGPGDNFGVHTNSGVQNHWFYLLCEGGDGTNDNGDDYHVEPIGIDAAMQIIMRSARYYLTPTATYVDGRQGSLFAVEDLYGSCSFEYQQVANAWHAVGVGQPSLVSDFTVERVEQFSMCDIEETRPVSVMLRHLGCDTLGETTLEITLLKSNPPQSFTETVVMDNVAPGAMITYTFEEEFDFGRKGEHVLSARVVSASDPNSGNNTSDQEASYNLEQVSLHNFPFYTNIAPRTFKDSMAFVGSDFVTPIVLNAVGKDSTAGIKIEGDRARYANPVYPGQDIFDVNPRQKAELCWCMNATGLDSLGLQWDMRQTYAPSFAEMVGVAQPPTSALRVKIDGEEVARYLPDTPEDDGWRRHNIDLEAQLGTEFSICFETRTIQSLAEDHDTIGDLIFLDNIAFIGSEIQSSIVSPVETLPLTISPNPAIDQALVQWTGKQAGNVRYTLMNLEGRIFDSGIIDQIPGDNQLMLEVDNLVAGVYVVRIDGAGQIFTGKLAIL